MYMYMCIMYYYHRVGCDGASMHYRFYETIADFASHKHNNTVIQLILQSTNITQIDTLKGIRQSISLL